MECLHCQRQSRSFSRGLLCRHAAPLPVEHTASPIIGFRAWSIAVDRFGQNGALYPLTGNIAWTNGINEAVCDNGYQLSEYTDVRNLEPHTTPSAYCTCGIYAWNNWEWHAQYRTVIEREYPDTRIFDSHMELFDHYDRQTG